MTINLNEKDTSLYSELVQTYFYELGFFTASLKGLVTVNTDVKDLRYFDNFLSLSCAYATLSHFLNKKNLPLLAPLDLYLECSLERML